MFLSDHHPPQPQQRKVNMALGRGFLLVLVMLVSCLAVPSLGADYIVGGSNGWTMGVDYTTWTTGRTFSVGDTLVFNYAGGHTVDEVTESDYKTCTVGSSITTDSSGATAITLTTPGSHYFICGIMGHCGIGMKLAVNVAATVGAGVIVSSSQPPHLPYTALQPGTSGLGFPLPPLGSGLGLPPLGSGVALPPSSFGLRSMNPSIAGSRNVNNESLAPSTHSSSISLPDSSAASASVGSKLLVVFVAWGSVLVFGLF